MVEIGLLLISLSIILLGAEVFTNAIEWLGKRLNLSEGAVGSLLAAVGTALPETMIPIIAILSAKEGSEQIGIGAILGAPFMLATLALGITGIAVILFRRRRLYYPRMQVDVEVIARDISFFILVYAIAISAAFIESSQIKTFLALSLVGAYFFYVWITLQGKKSIGEVHQIKPLYISRKNSNPRILLILAQVAGALGLIFFGAHMFIDVIKIIADYLDIPKFILALIIAPVATELPEKFNSIIWVREGKDTLALGNITGAMVFQSSLIPAFGIIMTSWELSKGAFVSAILALLSSGLILIQIRRKGYLTPYILLSGVIFYTFFAYLIVKRLI